MSENQLETDVLVVGGGPAGTTVSRLLATSGWRCLLLSYGAKSVDRLEVLPPIGRQVFETLGLSGLLDDQSLCRPCLGVRRQWGSTPPEVEDFLHHRGSIGFVIDRIPFDNRLRELANAAGVERLEGRVTSATAGPTGIVVRAIVRDEVTVRARIAIDASGRPAALARRLGARRVSVDTLIAVREVREPLPKADSGATWLEIRGDDKRWSYEVSGLARRDHWSVGRRTSPQSLQGRDCVDASAALLKPAAGHHWIAIGDAAVAFDPIASQGLVTSFASAAEAARLILAHGDITPKTATEYSDKVDATFRYSETGRRWVYAAAASRPQDKFQRFSEAGVS